VGAKVGADPLKFTDCRRGRRQLFSSGGAECGDQVLQRVLSGHRRNQAGDQEAFVNQHV
jgi:hypothetical protein